MSETPADYLVAPVTSTSRDLALKELAALSALASENWATRKRLGGGLLVGGPVHHLARGSGQGQIACFTLPRLPDDDHRDPGTIQDANVNFAVACVAFVRALLSGSD